MRHPWPRDPPATSQIVAYRWDDATGSWSEIPVQVDERFPYFLANGRSDFGFYSGTDTELTYAWGPTLAPDGRVLAEGEEAWKKVAGTCVARYPQDLAEVEQLIAEGIITPGAGETAEDYLGPMADPVTGLDADDELAFLASDAGAVAPPDAPSPSGTVDGSRHLVTLADPLDPAETRAVYPSSPRAALPSTTRPAMSTTSATRTPTAGSTAASGPRMTPRSWAPPTPATARTCPGPSVATSPPISTATSTPRWCATRATASPSTASRSRPPGTSCTPPVAGRSASSTRRARSYGPDLLDRWKGRAFQQSPDSSISLVGFEDEQVDWEANSTLLGWRVGPVRALREI